MENLKFEMGDRCWIHEAQRSPDNPLTEATVVHKFHLDGWAIDWHYVVEVTTSIVPVLYVRTGHTMSDSPDKQIGMWRRNG